MNRMIHRLAVISMSVVFWGFVLGANNVSGAETPEEFYLGKTLMIVTSDPGGPTDFIARTIAPFLEMEIGARVRVENRKTDEVMNYLYKQGMRGGLTLGVKASDGIIGNEILKAPGVQYETDKFNFVADVYPAVKVFQISPKLPYKTLDALKKAKGLRGGGTSAKGSIALSSAVMLEILGIGGKVITGYKGKKELTLAMARGEVDFLVTTDNSAMRDEQDGYVVNLMVLGDKRSVAVPHVPCQAELGIKVSKDMGPVYKFITTGGMAVALPPGVPQDLVEFLSNSFQIISKNKELHKGIEKMTGTSTGFLTGKEVQQTMAEIKADKDVAAKLDTIFKKYTAVR